MEDRPNIAELLLEQIKGIEPLDMGDTADFPPVDIPISLSANKNKKDKKSDSEILQEINEKLESSKGPLLNQEAEIYFSEVCKALFTGESALSRLYVRVHKKQFCFDPVRDRWMKFQGVAWREDYKEESLFAVEVVAELLKALLDHRDFISFDKDTSDYIMERVKALHSRERMTSLRRLAQAGEDGLAIDPKVWDSQIRYVAAQNGAVDLTTGELLTEDLQNLYFTLQANVAYNPEAPEPELFLETLRDIFACTVLPPSVENTETVGASPQNPQLISSEIEKYCAEQPEMVAQTISYIQRLLGYALTGTCREHALFMFYGKEGRNGKGVLLRAITGVLGDYAGDVRPELLLRSSINGGNMGPNSALIDLQGKRLAIASEVSQGDAFDTSVVKRLTGADTLVGRAPYARSETRFTPTHTFILQTNFTPAAPAEDIAFWRRIKVIPFNRSFVENPDPDNVLQAQVDKDLERKLEAEYEGIFKWIIDGAVAYNATGSLNEPAWLASAVSEYRKNRDTLGEFIAECCFTGPERTAKTAVFHKYFTRWLKDNGYKSWNKTTIRDRLERQGFTHKRSNGSYYVGISLNFDSDYISDVTPQLETVMPHEKTMRLKGND